MAPNASQISPVPEQSGELPILKLTDLNVHFPIREGLLNRSRHTVKRWAG